MSKIKQALCFVTLALMLGALLLSPTLRIATAQGVSLLQNVRELNGQAPRLLSEYQRALSATDQLEIRERAGALLQKRFVALQELARQNPAAAVAMALPSEVLQELRKAFPEISGALELQGEWFGQMKVLVEDDENLRDKAYYWLEEDNQTLELHFAGPVPILKSGDAVVVSGVRLGTVTAVSDSKPALAKVSTATGCSTFGPQKIVVILVNFQTITLPSTTTPEYIKGILFGNEYSSAQSSTDWSVRHFWEQNSDGQTTVDVTGSTVVGPFTLPSDYNDDTHGDGVYRCLYQEFLSDAMAAADPSVDFTQYNRVMVVFPQNTKTNVDGSTGGCTWSGKSNVGCSSTHTTDGSFTASATWLNANRMLTRDRGVMLFTHEGGHALGMMHGRSRDFGSEALGPIRNSGTYDEYGDPFTAMGAWSLGFYNAKHMAEDLGWLALGNNYQLVEQSGIYPIQNYEARPAGLTALKVRRANRAWLWLECRTNTGIYDSTLNPAIFNGLLMHYQDSNTYNASDLLDFTPATPTFMDAALASGQTWTDPYTDLSIRVISANSTSLTVEVRYGVEPCVPGTPTITLAPAALSVMQGNSNVFTVTVQNADTGSCSGQFFDLSAELPSGWTYAFANPMLTLTPGQSAQTTLTVSVPSTQPLGTFPITVAAASNSNYSTAAADVTVTEPVYSLNLSVSGKGSIRNNPPNVVCSGACSQQYAQSANQLVTLTAQPTTGQAFAGWTGACTGMSTTCTVTMNANKSVTAKFGKK